MADERSTTSTKAPHPMTVVPPRPQARALSAFSVTVDGAAYSFAAGAVVYTDEIPFDPELMEAV